jgi:hypothetical protein
VLLVLDGVACVVVVVIFVRGEGYTALFQLYRILAYNSFNDVMVKHWRHNFCYLSN